MNSIETSGRKRSGETDFSYCPSKKISALEELDEGESEGDGSKNENEVKSVKPVSSKENFAEKYMKKHGYKKGSGIGKLENGMINPVEASKQKGTRGFGFQPDVLNAAISKFDPSLEEVSVQEEFEWLINDYEDTLTRDCLESWVKTGYSKRHIDSNSQFCDSLIINNICSTKNVLSKISEKEKKSGTGRSNPFECIHNAIFLNRAAMKMANLDAILDRMFTNPKDINGDEIIGPNKLLYFADVCAGPGGFSEYVLYRKKWRAKGFGFTLRQINDFQLDQFWAGPSESFEPHYGKFKDGNVYLPENILSFKEHVLKHTDSIGVHFMMADGGFSIEEQKNDQELLCKKLYLCQCLIALLIVRTGGHFVVKLFDLFTDFSVGLIYLMYRSFRQISIIKPNTSRPANSERYLVCKWKLENGKEIGEHLFEINNRVPVFNEKEKTPEEDVLELVPSSVLLNDKKFYNYIRESNNRFGEKQVVGLLKLITYSENVELRDERQQELRKECLKKWDIPDEARAEPRKCEARVKWMELVGNFAPSSLDTDVKKSTLHIDTFRENICPPYNWYCLVLSGEESNNTCTFYLSLGRNHVQKYTSGRWMKLSSDSQLCLPENTLVYGEIVNEYLGSGRGQRKISAFHIIDGLFLGKEDIRTLPFQERLSMCELFAKSLYKETCPIRVKTPYHLPKIQVLKESLVLKATKSSSLRSLCVPLGNDSFFKAGGIMLIRDTKDNWNRFMSKTHGLLYVQNFAGSVKDSIYERDVKKRNMSQEVYADFECSYANKLIWWWDDKIIYDLKTGQQESTNVKWSDIINLVEKE